ncbi:MAG TPA: EAL domain-containing protein [Thermoanaerobaculia bacterium]|nr:EAL domain-containing protein [Thermoanaerobaculia bacterium]
MEFCQVNHLDPEHTIDLSKMGMHGNLGVVFQPILEMLPKGRLFAIECLSRGPEGSALEPADELFAWVRKRRLEYVVDQVCITNVLREAAELPGAPDLCINVHSKTLSSPEFPDFVERATEQYGIPPSRIIFEIVEHASSNTRWEPPPAGLSRLRSLGFRLAMDDFGVGHSNLQRLLEWHPDYLKISRYFVAGCAEDPRRLDIIETVVQLAQRFGLILIAEGIENALELDLIGSFGINHLQGFFFSPPLKVQGLMELGVLRNGIEVL